MVFFLKEGNQTLICEMSHTQCVDEDSLILLDAFQKSYPSMKIAASTIALFNAILNCLCGVVFRLIWLRNLDTPIHMEANEFRKIFTVCWYSCRNWWMAYIGLYRAYRMTEISPRADRDPRRMLRIGAHFGTVMGSCIVYSCITYFGFTRPSIAFCPFNFNAQDAYYTNFNETLDNTTSYTYSSYDSGTSLKGMWRLSVSQDTGFNSVCMIFFSGVNIGIPFFIVTASSIFLWNMVARGARNVGQRYTRIALILSLIVTSFFCLEGPRLVVGMMQPILHLMKMSCVTIIRSQHSVLVTEFIGQLNSSINLIIYVGMDNIFRETMLKIFRTMLRQPESSHSDSNRGGAMACIGDEATGNGEHTNVTRVNTNVLRNGSLPGSEENGTAMNIYILKSNDDNAEGEEDAILSPEDKLLTASNEQNDI